MLFFESTRKNYLGIFSYQDPKSKLLSFVIAEGGAQHLLCCLLFLFSVFFLYVHTSKLQLIAAFLTPQTFEKFLAQNRERGLRDMVKPWTYCNNRHCPSSTV
jgi:hypothetical protein